MSARGHADKVDKPPKNTVQNSPEFTNLHDSDSVVLIRRRSGSSAIVKPLATKPVMVNDDDVNLLICHYIWVQKELSLESYDDCVLMCTMLHNGTV